MSNYNHHQAPVAYPPAQTSYPPPAVEGYTGGPQVMAPPPMGYPTQDGAYGEEHHKHSSGKTTSRGDGFWKGCFAALCCCCVLEACF